MWNLSIMHTGGIHFDLKKTKPINDVHERTIPKEFKWSQAGNEIKAFSCRYVATLGNRQHSWVRGPRAMTKKVWCPLSPLGGTVTLQQSGLRHPDVIEIVKVSFALSAHFLRFERSSFASRAQSDVTFMFRNHIHCLSRVWLTQTFSDSNQGVNMSGLGKSVLFPQSHQQFIPSSVITFLTFAEVVKSSPVTKRVTKC